MKHKKFLLIALICLIGIGISFLLFSAQQITNKLYIVSISFHFLFHMIVFSLLITVTVAYEASIDRFLQSTSTLLNYNLMDEMHQDIVY